MAREISARDAQDRIAMGDIDVVDVREPHEWATGHISSARLVPLGSLLGDWDAAQVRDPVLFVCARGGRSATAAELAAKKGLREVLNLEDGMAGWKAASLPITVPAQPSSTSGASDEPGTEIVSDPELDAVIAANVRELRSHRGYTLDVLAGLTGVGRQTLGQIELGRTVPSVATLWKIATALAVPFATLIARPTSAVTQVLRQATAKRLVSVDGRFSSRALFPPDQHGKVEFYELWLAAHGREDAEAHAPGTRENLVVTAGRLVLELRGERHELAAGDAIVFVADAPHAYVNPANEDCRMNLVMTYAS